MTKLRRVVATALACATLTCSPTRPYSPLLDALYSALPDERLRLLEPVSRWTEALGEPLKAIGGDGHPALLWWPKHGIAVAANPYFEGQRLKRPFEQWQITSIVVPLASSISLRDPAAHATFDTAIGVSVDGKALADWTLADFAGRFQQLPDQAVGVLRFQTKPPSHRFRATEFTVHCEDARPVAIQLSAEFDLLALD